MKLNQSVGMKLLKVVFAIYFIIALLVTGVQCYVEYVDTKENLSQELADLLKTFTPGITTQVWEYDEEGLESLLFGLNEINTIVGTKIVDQNGDIIGKTGIQMGHNELRSSDSESDSIFGFFSISTPLEYTDELGKKHDLGFLYIHSSNNTVIDRIKYGFFLIIINSVIKTFALWFVFLFFVKKKVSNPLIKLKDNLNLFSVKNPQYKKVSGENIEERDDEIGLLYRKYEEMQFSIVDQFNQLKSQKNQLQTLSKLAKFLYLQSEIRGVGECIQGILQELFGKEVTFALYLEKKLIETPDLARDEKTIFTLIKKCSSQEVPETLDSAVELEGLEKNVIYSSMEDITLGFLFLKEGCDENQITLLCHYLLGALEAYRKEKKLIKETQHKAELQASLKTAYDVQLSLLAKSGDVPGLDISDFYQPAEQTGGDWFGYYYDPHKKLCFMCCGDVTGHGISAALLVGVATGCLDSVFGHYFAKTKYGLDYQAEDAMKECMLHLNTSIYNAGHMSNMAMTMSITALDLKTGQLWVTNAGHCHPFIYAPDKMKVIVTSGRRLGFLPEREKTKIKKAQLHSGECLVMYTDGLLETPGEDGNCITLRGIGGLKRDIHDFEESSKTLQVILNEARQTWAGRYSEGKLNLEDDCTIVVYRWVGDVQEQMERPEKKMALP